MKESTHTETAEAAEFNYKEKVYGRIPRIAALLAALEDGAPELADKCIDLMYSIMVNY